MMNKRQIIFIAVAVVVLGGLFLGYRLGLLSNTDNSQKLEFQGNKTVVLDDYKLTLRIPADWEIKHKQADIIKTIEYDVLNDGRKGYFAGEMLSEPFYEVTIPQFSYRELDYINTTLTISKIFNTPRYYETQGDGDYNSPFGTNFRYTEEPYFHLVSGFTSGTRGIGRGDFIVSNAFKLSNQYDVLRYLLLVGVSDDLSGDDIDIYGGITSKRELTTSSLAENNLLVLTGQQVGDIIISFTIYGQDRQRPFGLLEGVKLYAAEPAYNYGMRYEYLRDSGLLDKIIETVNSVQIK